MNTYDGIAWTYEKGKAIWAGIRSGYEAIMLSIKQRSLLVDEKDLAISIGKAAMGVISSLSSIPVVGWALGLAAAAAVIGLGAKFMMKDGVIDPKKGPVMTGEFGSVQLDPNDKAMYGADGKIKVGTNLGGGQSTMSAAARRSDSSNEIKQMRQENRQLLTALLNKSTDIYMSSNKVGTSVVLGAQKSS